GAAAFCAAAGAAASRAAAAKVSESVTRMWKFLPLVRLNRIACISVVVAWPAKTQESKQAEAADQVPDQVGSQVGLSCWCLCRCRCARERSSNHKSRYPSSAHASSLCRSSCGARAIRAERLIPSSMGHVNKVHQDGSHLGLMKRKRPDRQAIRAPCVTIARQPPWMCRVERPQSLFAAPNPTQGSVAFGSVLTRPGMGCLSPL